MDESDALKVLLAAIEMWFREKYTALAEAINEHKAMRNEQKIMLKAVCCEVMTMDEKVDVPLFTHRSSWARQVGRCCNRPHCPGRGESEWHYFIHLKSERAL